MRSTSMSRRRTPRHRPFPAACAALMLLASFVIASAGHAAIVGGVVVNGPGPAPIAGTPRGTQRTMVTQIDFDESLRPCLFIESNPLRDEYLAQGVSFAGSNSLGGGAVLDQCGSFGVIGHSEPNFLAFNPIAVMLNGGVPDGPQHLLFPEPVVVVEMGIGGNGGGTFEVTAYNALHEVVDTDEGASSSVLSVYTVSGSGIVEVQVRLKDTIIREVGWVIDDLSFSTDPTVTHASTWGRIKSIYR